MGILIPLVAPLAWKLSGQSLPVLTSSLGAVMGGSVFGNVCSPLGDTSVLTPMVCRCDMMEHVTSQATYVGLVAALSLAFPCLQASAAAPIVEHALCEDSCNIADHSPPINAQVLEDPDKDGKPKHAGDLRLPSSVDSPESTLPQVATRIST